MKRRLLFWLFLGCALLACARENEPACGDGRLDPGEDCDGRALAGTYGTWSCVAHGYNGGEAVCSDQCTFSLEPCKETGRCGDGVLNAAYEECDPLGPITCASIGHASAPGYAACSTDCRIDISPCARCGDGILQPEFGERVEQDFETCRRLGFFGGVHTTGDCLTGSTEHCGDFLLLQGDTSLEFAVLAGVDSSELWVTGLVDGVFPGPQDPACPTLVQVLTDEESSHPGELVGYEWSGCAGSVLLSIRQGEQSRPLPAAGQFGMVRGIHPMDQRVVLVGDLPGQMYGLRVLERDGTELAQVPLNRSMEMMIPRIRGLSKDELAVLHTPKYSSLLQISVFSASRLALTPVAALNLRALELQDSLSTHGDHRFLPLGDDRWLFVLFLRGNYPAVGKVVLVRARAVGGLFETEAIAELADAPATLADLRIGAGGEVLEWIGWDAVPNRLRIARWDLDGGYLGSAEHPLPEGHGLEWARAMPDGRILLGGVAYLGSEGPGACPLLGGTDLPIGVFAGVLTGTGELLVSAPFHASGMKLSESDNYLSWRQWTYARVRPSTTPDDHPQGTLPPPAEERLYVYGTYSRTEPFCAEQELVASHLGYPVFSRGVFVVELALPAQ